MKIGKKALLTFLLTCSATLWGDSYQYVSECTGSGKYDISQAGTDFVLSGEIDGDVTVKLPDRCRVTLSDVAMSGVLTIKGDAELWLVGENSVTDSGASAIVCDGTLTIGGTGSLNASAAGGKKIGVVSSESLVLAGGTTTLTILNPTKKNVCGVSLSGDYVQTDGTLTIVGMSADSRQNGVLLSKKNTAATITGGLLDVTLAGEKSVGLAMDKGSIAGEMSGGTLKFTMSGDGARGVKGDGTFTMTGGTLDATMTGGVVEDYFEYEDEDGVTWNFYVALTSSTKTSGGMASFNTSSLIANGTYPVMDPSTCYAVKVGTLDISGGEVKIFATGTAGRGLGADNMTLSGGTYDITVTGGPTDVYVESLVESGDLDDTTYANGVTTRLDSGGAACLKTSGADGVLTISGGTFNMKATGDAGKLISAAGYLVIGTEGQKTLPTDTSFSPDISGSITGGKVYCTAIKYKFYGALATAIPTKDLKSMTLSVANDSLVKSSTAFAPPPLESGAMPGGPGGGAPGGIPGGAVPSGVLSPDEMPEGMPAGMPGRGADDIVDYSNPKGVKGYSGVTIHGGRIVLTSKNDGGEGLESNNDLTINGGVLDFQCHDDCINSGGDLYINDGYIYALSTGNDAIDSNGNVYMTGGIVLAFCTGSGMESGIDAGSSSGFVVSGGHLVAVGGTVDNMIIGSSGSQKTYRNVSVPASKYSGKYLSMAGTDTFTVKMPTLSGTVSLVCTTVGWTSAAAPTVCPIAPTDGAIGFHDVYLSGSPANVFSLFPNDATAASKASAVYNGFVMDGGSVVGTVLLKVGRANKRTGMATFKASVQMLGSKKKTYVAKVAVSDSVPTTVTLPGTMTLTVTSSSLSGDINGLPIVGARNMSSVKEMRSGEYAAWTGVYNTALVATDAEGAGASFAAGYSSLAVTVSSKGRTKVTGMMSDGSKVSVPNLQLMLSSDTANACIPVLVPLYGGKLGGFGFLLWLSSDKTATVTALSEWNASVSSSAPFIAGLDCVDAGPMAKPADGAHAFAVDAASVPSTMKGHAVRTDLLPVDFIVSCTSGKLSAANDNASSLKISGAAKTGLFSGSFVIFTENGTRLRKSSVPFNGVFVNGIGYGAAAIKKVGSASVTIK